MMLHNFFTKGHKAKFALAMTIGIAFTTSTAMAQGIAVDSSRANAGLAEANNTLNNVNVNSTAQVGLAEELLAGVGTQGTRGSPTQGALGTAIGTGAEFYQNMQRFSYDMCAVTLCANGDPVGTTDIEEAREWAMENLFARDVLDGATRRDLNEIRRRAVAYSATNALALSVTVHNDLAGADGTANALEDKISQSLDLRGDVQANSTILLAQYKVALQELAVMNAMMTVMATSGIRSSDIYHEEGGTNFADALNDADFSDPGFSVRTQVTPPERGGSGALNLLP